MDIIIADTVRAQEFTNIIIKGQTLTEKNASSLRVEVTLHSLNGSRHIIQGDTTFDFSKKFMKEYIMWFNHRGKYDLYVTVKNGEAKEEYLYNRIIRIR